MEGELEVLSEGEGGEGASSSFVCSRDVDEAGEETREENPVVEAYFDFTQSMAHHVGRLPQAQLREIYTKIRGGRVSASTFNTQLGMTYGEFALCVTAPNPTRSRKTFD